MMTLSAILLVGGRSSRMGVDKATLVIGGEPLWQRQLRMLEQLTPGRVALSAPVPPPWCPPEIELITDAAPARGPLSGVVAGLGHLSTSHLLVLAIDLPNMNAEHLCTLWNHAAPGCGVIPKQDDYLEPLCAIYPAEAAGEAEAVLRHGNASLQTFGQKLLHLPRAKLYNIIPAEAPLYLNMNTPVDVPLGK
jgi:molybdopterin-guanine dinucleotide biosynthesis protein A